MVLVVKRVKKLYVCFGFAHQRELRGLGAWLPDDGCDLHFDLVLLNVVRLFPRWGMLVNTRRGNILVSWLLSKLTEPINPSGMPVYLRTFAAHTF